MSLAPYWEGDGITLYHGRAEEVLPGLPDASVDCVVSDPPYACVQRGYGYWTEAEWHVLMQEVVRECRRVLKPSGSAVFILQPNFERVGKMRLWLWRFLLWAAEEWNLVQDAYWWNFTAMPGAGVKREVGLLRASVKLCLWLGPEYCYRNQDAVTWTESEANRAQRLAYRAGQSHSGVQPSGHSRDRGKMAGAAARRFPSGREKNMERITRGREHRPSGWSVDDGKATTRFGDLGCVTPFNLLPISNTDSESSAGSYGHGAGTPLALCRWWVRYLAPPGRQSVVLDPFSGTATVGEAAHVEGCRYIGIEKDEVSCRAAVERCGRLKQGVMSFGDAPPPPLPLAGLLEIDP